MFPCGRLLAADSLPDGHPQKALLERFNKDYRAEYGTHTSTFGGHALDAINLVVEALKAGADDREKIREYIENKKNFVGTGGIFNYSPTNHVGLDVSAFEMLMVKDRTFVVAE